MDFLDFIPEPLFDVIGTVAGLFSCTVVLIQVIKEWRDQRPSTLSMANVIGWFFIFLFWLFYGIRFRAVALWLSNSIAVVLQLALFLVVVRKKKIFSTELVLKED